MPPLLCAPPILLDQTFPRNAEELDVVGDALGEIERCVGTDEAHLVMTEYLSDTVEDFDWNRIAKHPRLGDIRRLLVQWFLQPHTRLIVVDLKGLQDYTPHPVPEGCKSTEGLTEFWADELGRLLVRHDECSDGGMFIAVACAYAFAGGSVGKYDNPQRSKAFPLIGVEGLSGLEDAYAWDVAADLRQQSVSVRDAMRSLRVIGGVVERAKGTSHHKVRFADAPRSWVLDDNVDPIPDRFLAELTMLTPYPLEVIKSALINGSLPRRVLKLLK